MRRLWDGDLILPMYRKYGPPFVQRLDGEFAMVVVDLRKQRILLATDVFGTKPHHFAVFGDGEFLQVGTSSYRSGLARSGAPGFSIRPMRPNLVLVLEYEVGGSSGSISAGGEEGAEGEENTSYSRFAREELPRILEVIRMPQSAPESASSEEPPPGNTYLNEVFPQDDQHRVQQSSPGGGIVSLRMLDAFPAFEFDLRQHKTDYTDAIAAFERSVEKRVQTSLHPPFLGLSAGYDAGAVHLALTKNNIPHYYYTIMGVEDMKVIRRRNDYSEGVARALLIDFSYEIQLLGPRLVPHIKSRKPP